MSTQEPQAQNATNRPVGDTGKRCAKCGYNLTGLTEPRCPECGAVHLDPPPKSFAAQFLNNQLLGAVRISGIGAGLAAVAVIDLLAMPNRPSFVLMLPSDSGLGAAIFFVLQIPCTVVGVTLAQIGILSGAHPGSFRKWRLALLVAFLASFAIIVLRIFF